MSVNPILVILVGLAYGAVLFLIASGLSLVMGLMGIVNMAHGATLVWGGYVGITVANETGNYLYGILAGMFASGTLGLLIERGFLRGLYKKPLEQILITFGFVYMLTNTAVWIWGGGAMSPIVPSFLGGHINVGGSPFPVVRLFVIGFGLVLALGLWWLQDRTRVGAIVRAGMDDAEMVEGSGINLTPITVGVFFFSTLIGGLAILVGGPVMERVWILFNTDILWLALSVVIVGGMGSIQGALVGALLIGMADTVGKMYFQGIAVYVPYALVILVLIIRPSGLMGKARSRV